MERPFVLICIYHHLMILTTLLCSCCCNNYQHCHNLLQFFQESQYCLLAIAFV
nr:MAG TPA: hypothetical protein [Caudoviricetes sp.]